MDGVGVFKIQQRDEKEELKEALENLYWRGIHTAALMLSTKTEEERAKFFEHFCKLPFKSFCDELKAFSEWRYSGETLQ